MKLEAKRLCDSCPVNLLCHEWATANDEEGVWAGTTRDERRAVRATRDERRDLTRQRLTLVA